MSSKRRQEGYLLIDHRHSPGLNVPGLGEGQLFEAPTVTCSHCQAVVIVSPTRTRSRHYCQKCDHYVCDKPECSLACTPWLQVLDQAADAAHHGPVIVPNQSNPLVGTKEIVSG